MYHHHLALTVLSQMLVISICKEIRTFKAEVVQERHSMRSLKKRRRRLQRIRNDKFTEYFQSRAVGVGGEGGHGYLGINLHGSDD